MLATSTCGVRVATCNIRAIRITYLLLVIVHPLPATAIVLMTLPSLAYLLLALTSHAHLTTPISLLTD